MSPEHKKLAEEWYALKTARASWLSTANGAIAVNVFQVPVSLIASALGSVPPWWLFLTAPLVYVYAAWKYFSLGKRYEAVMSTDLSEKPKAEPQQKALN